MAGVACGAGPLACVTATIGVIAVGSRSSLGLSGLQQQLRAPRAVSGRQPPLASFVGQGECPAARFPSLLNPSRTLSPLCHRPAPRPPAHLPSARPPAAAPPPARPRASAPMRALGTSALLLSYNQQWRSGARGQSFLTTYMYRSAMCQELARQNDKTLAQMQEKQGYWGGEWETKGRKDHTARGRKRARGRPPTVLPQA